MRKVKLYIDSVSTYALWNSKIRCDNEEEEAIMFKALEKHDIRWVSGSPLKCFDPHQTCKSFPIGFTIRDGKLAVASCEFDEEVFDKISLLELTAKKSAEIRCMPKREWDIARAKMLLQECLRLIESDNFPPFILLDEVCDLVNYYNE